LSAVCTNHFENASPDQHCQARGSFKDKTLSARTRTRPIFTTPFHLSTQVKTLDPPLERQSDAYRKYGDRRLAIKTPAHTAQEPAKPGTHKVRPRWPFRKEKCTSRFLFTLADGLSEARRLARYLSVKHCTIRIRRFFDQ
jgi:hypothetical protein